MKISAFFFPLFPPFPYFFPFFSFPFSPPPSVCLPPTLAQLVRASPGELMVVGSSPTRGSQFFFEKCLFRASCVVLLCLSVVVLLLPCLSQHLLKDCSCLINKHWSPIHNDPTLSTLFPTLPQLCFWRNSTIAGSLVKAALPGAARPPTGQVPPISIPRLDSRMVRCADKPYKVCPNAEGICVLFSAVSKTPYTSMKLSHVQIPLSFTA